MKITQVISDTSIGGAGILLSHIAGALAEEHDLEILLPKNSLLISRLPKTVRITPFPMHGGDSIADVPRFLQYLREHPCDVLHTHAAFSARLAGALCGIPRLYSTRHCAMGAHNTPPLYAKLYNRVTSLTVATACAAAEELIAEGVPKEKIRVIYNGVAEPQRFTSAEKRAMLKKLRLTEKDTVIGCCGRLEHVKGQDILIEAAATLMPRFPSLHLLLVGDGSRMQALIALAERLGICEHVHFVGYTPTPAIYQSLFTLNVNPSRGTETSCLATSECAALGIPTVASDFGGNRECVAHEVSGLLFKSEDKDALAAAIERALTDTELKRLLCKGARRRYETMFTLSHMLDGYRRLYAENS